MKNVDIIYFGYMRASNGVTTILRKYISNKQLFKEQNLNLNVYSLDGVNVISQERGGNLRTKNNGFFYDIILKKTAAYFWKSAILIYMRNFRNAKISVEKFFKQHRSPNILFFQDIFSAYYFLKRKNKYEHLKNVKCVLILHTNGETFKMLLDYFPKIKNSFVHRILLKCERFVLKGIDKVGFVAESSQTLFLKINPEFNKKKTFFVHNGVEHLELSKKKLLTTKPLTFISAASISLRKGQDILVEAIKNLSLEDRDCFRFILLGDGPLKKTLEQDVDKYNLNKYFKFLGNVENVSTYLDEADIFILCSRDEGLPMSIIEAMRAGLPIVGSNIAGIPELITHNKNGFLVEPNVDSLISCLEGIARMDMNKLNEMGRASREIFEEKFTLDKMINEYCKILTSL